MATIVRRRGGYRVQIRRAGHKPLSKDFRTQAEAARWARAEEARLDVESRTPVEVRVLLADVIRTYRENAGATFGDTKRRCIDRLESMLGHHRIGELTCTTFSSFVTKRAEQGAGAVTVGTDLSYLSTVLRYGGSMSGVQRECALALAELRTARTMLTHTGQVAASAERDRRPTEDELLAIRKRLALHRRVMPLWDLVMFSIATCMRIGEITRITWEDFDAGRRMLTIRQRKNPRKNKDPGRRFDQTIPLLSGHVVIDGQVIDPVEIIERAGARPRTGRIFPYRREGASTRFWLVVTALKIDDLNLHDMRHDGISRMFEAGYTIEQVASVSGHKDWKHLRRYTHLQPAAVRIRSAIGAAEMQRIVDGASK
jgi:integrase